MYFKRFSGCILKLDDVPTEKGALDILSRKRAKAGSGDIGWPSLILNYAQFALNDMGKFTKMMRKSMLSRLCMLIADVLYCR